MSCPELAARVFGMTSSASANAMTPHFALPFTVLLKSSLDKWAAQATWNAPPPVSYCILDLSDGVRIGAFDEQRHRLGLLDIFLHGISGIYIRKE